MSAPPNRHRGGSTSARARGGHGRLGRNNVTANSEAAPSVASCDIGRGRGSNRPRGLTTRGRGVSSRGRGGGGRGGRRGGSGAANSANSGPIKCFNCGEEGHRKTECTNERISRCSVCGHEDHTVRDCPDKHERMFFGKGVPLPKVPGAPHDLPGQWIRREQYPHPKAFGYFQCLKCQHEWSSAHAFRKGTQDCIECAWKASPLWMWLQPQADDETNQSEREHDSKQPHPEHLCNTCKKIGASCWRYSAAEVERMIVARRH